MPALWEDEGYEGLNGVAWYRTSVELTEDEAGQSLRLRLGPIDDSDVTWVNGQEVDRRLARADNPERVNLYNEAGLPATPFRTDEW